MKQLNRFKVGDVVITKFPVKFKVNEEDPKFIDVTIKEYVRPCFHPDCESCGEKFDWFELDTTIDRKLLNTLKLVPKVTNGVVGYHLELIVSKVTNGKRFQIIEFENQLTDGKIVYGFNHYSFIKKV